jgi:hypoxanthine phosphoribosyltransferase
VKIACLLFKPNALETNTKPDYCALEIPNDFIVGYGLDYDGIGRNLRNIYKIKQEDK